MACQNATQEKQMNEETLYRPLLHFTPKAHWMNDPNGMFYLNGKYHLYFQYYQTRCIYLASFLVSLQGLGFKSPEEISC